MTVLGFRLHDVSLGLHVLKAVALTRYCIPISQHIDLLALLFEHQGSRGPAMTPIVFYQKHLVPF